MNRIPNASELVIESGMYQRYALRVDSSTTPEEVLEPSFWWKIGKRLQVGDIIEVFDTNNSIDMSLRVVSVFNARPTLRVLRQWFNEDAASDAGAGADTDNREAAVAKGDMFYWRSLADGTFSVVNLVTKAPAQQGLSKRDAIARCEAMNAQARAA